MCGAWYRYSIGFLQLEKVPIYKNFPLLPTFSNSYKTYTIPIPNKTYKISYTLLDVPSNCYNALMSNT